MRINSYFKVFYEKSKEILHKIELAPFCAIHFSVYSGTKGKHYFSNVIPHFKSRLHEVFHKNKMYNLSRKTKNYPWLC